MKTVEIMPQGRHDSWTSPLRLPGSTAGALGFDRPVLTAVAGYIPGQFQTAPDIQRVERRAQVILDDLLAGADDLSDFAMGQPLPDEDRNLNFFRAKTFHRAS